MMTEYIRQRPWIWVIVLLGLFVSINVIMLVVATSSHGPDLLDTAPAVERAR